MDEPIQVYCQVKCSFADDGSGIIFACSGDRPGMSQRELIEMLVIATAGAAAKFCPDRQQVQAKFVSALFSKPKGMLQ